MKPAWTRRWPACAMSSATEFALDIDADLARRAEALLEGRGSASRVATFTPIVAGVSSELWRVDVGSTRRIVVKRALPRLKVAQRVARAGATQCGRSALVALRRRAWLRARCRRWSPTMPQAGIAILGWFDPSRWTNWKVQLMKGLVRPAVGTEMGELLGGTASRAAHNTRNSRSRSTTWTCCRRCASSRSSSRHAAANPEVAHRLLESGRPSDDLPHRTRFTAT